MLQHFCGRNQRISVFSGEQLLGLVSRRFDARVHSTSLCFHVWHVKRVWRVVGAEACTFLFARADSSTTAKHNPTLRWMLV